MVVFVTWDSTMMRMEQGQWKLQKYKLNNIIRDKELGNAMAMTEQMKTEMQRLQLHMYWLQKTSVLNPCEIEKRVLWDKHVVQLILVTVAKTSSELIRNNVQKKMRWDGFALV